MSFPVHSHLSLPILVSCWLLSTTLLAQDAGRCRYGRDRAGSCLQAPSVRPRSAGLPQRVQVDTLQPMDAELTLTRQDPGVGERIPDLSGQIVQGSFSQETNLEPGTYVLEIESPQAYQPFRMVVQIRAHGTQELHVGLLEWAVLSVPCSETLERESVHLASHTRWLLAQRQYATTMSSSQAVSAPFE